MKQLSGLLLSIFTVASVCADDGPLRIRVTIDRGPDVGQCFGSLFEAKSEDGSLVIGAGFQNSYNTRYRADRHAIQFFIRPTSGDRELTVEELSRPTENLVGSYLFVRDGRVYSTFGGLRLWNAQARRWQDVEEVGGTHETMRVGTGILKFGSSTATFNGRTILEAPQTGTYQLFFYANGHLCFYHINRKDAPYHPYVSDEDGFSRLYACPWTSRQPTVDLSKAVTLRLPVVGETTFAWGTLGKQIVTGSNIGGFYVFENGAWSMQLEPSLKRSYQLYSTVSFHDHLLMGQYPTGRVFKYDGTTISDQSGWPPVLEGVSGSAREAQTTVIYGGDLFVGVWPWGEVWRYNSDSSRWTFMRRMFDQPALSDKIVHPYDVENRKNSVGNMWGQRVTSMVSNGPDLFVATSAKAPYEWQPGKYPFLEPEKWKAYGKVYRATMPGHLSASATWTDGPTRLNFVIRGTEVALEQDGKQLATTTLTGRLAKLITNPKSLKFQHVSWGDGIYGKFDGESISGSIDGK